MKRLGPILWLALGAAAIPWHAAAQTCQMWEMPTQAVCDSIVVQPLSDNAIRDRDIFLSWVLEEWRVGNITALRDVMSVGDPDDTIPPVHERYLWLSDKDGAPVETVLWCSLVSIKDTPVALSEFLVPELTQTENAAAVAEMTFWLGYDVLSQASRDVVAELDAHLTQSGELGTQPDDNASLSRALNDSECLAQPWTEAALGNADLPASPRFDSVESAGDAALQLAKALQTETAAYVSASADSGGSEDLFAEVNEALHQEVTGTGLIETRILSEARQILLAFQRLDFEITSHAGKINRLSADTMAVDRNIRTYSEVFADTDLGAFDNRFEKALIDLESVLSERGLLGPNVEPMWTDDKRRLNDENETVKLCKDNPDCGYCQLSDPISAENVEEHLVCFHAVGILQAKMARASILQQRMPQLPDDRDLTSCTALKALYSTPDGGEATDEEKHKAREEAARECFLDWMWTVDPVITARMEAAFAQSEE
ncbi:hypothetical protein [Ruegeria sp. HKCCD7318]|uniref:hypothetical protein n=1 Tax=Ruegeria sp. HKCCD7318 TaxID=2683014 RepID=UPI0014915FEE|nr:hypothetical protein [Ruegeria sp. HKCCD7318]NOE36227.1 hypothetical protein [Ruegeria sp. HKCCD7318]